MLEQFSSGTDNPVQTIDKRLVGDQPGESIKQVLLGEGEGFLDPRVTLFTLFLQHYSVPWGLCFI